jgi:hypothetical protein
VTSGAGRRTARLRDSSRMQPLSNPTSGNTSLPPYAERQKLVMRENSLYTLKPNRRKRREVTSRIWRWPPQSRQQQE